MPIVFALVPFFVALWMAYLLDKKFSYTSLFLLVANAMLAYDAFQRIGN